MKLSNLRVNQLKNPLGYDFSYMTMSWQVDNTDSAFSKAVRLVIWKNMEQTPCFDTGVMENYQENKYYVKMSLEPRTRYYWNVWVQGNKGDEAKSEMTWFETGKLNEGWKGQWISTPEDASRMPFLYKEFVCRKGLRRARLYTYGAGLYEAYLNEEKLGEEFLQPGYHSYDLRMEYQTLDITSQLIPGDNVLGILLGEGWYKGRFGFDGDFRNIYGDRKKCIVELYLSYEDGTEECIVSDDSWKAKESCVLQNSIYDGEWIDDTLECHELPVEILSNDTFLLVERTNPPLRKTESFKPIAQSWQEDGTLLLDFGESITGWVEWKGKLEDGQTIKLEYGEVLQNNRFYRENLRTAKAEFVYKSAGEDKRVRPHFTFYGFRYVQVSGLCPENMLSFWAYRIMSDILQTGKIITSNDKVNTLIENTRRSQKCNFLDIPTDCPQRDERMGWTGDVAIFAPTACFHADSAAFFRHYAKCLYEEQRLWDGAVPFFVPKVKLPAREGLNPFYITAGACGWADVATILPWTLYQYYGDKQLLKEQYPMMCDWVDYITTRSKENAVPYLWQNDRHLGDWLALDTGNPYSPVGKTDVQLLASAYYYYSTLLCSRAAAVLGDNRQKEFEVQAQRIKEAYISHYFTEDGDINFEPTQTACAIILSWDLCPVESRKQVVEMLKHLLKENGGMLNTGFLGTPVLCPALSENGCNDMAYNLLLNEEYPGWLHEVNMGATTVWERWNSLEEDGRISGTGMNSLNHYAYGSITEWMYKYMCGFRPQIGEQICMLLKPMPDPRFSVVEGHWISLYGEFVSGWTYAENERLSYYFEVPFNARTKVTFPNGQSSILTAGKYKFDSQGNCLSE